MILISCGGDILPALPLPQHGLNEHTDYLSTMKPGNPGLDPDFIGEHWGRNLPVDRVEYSRAALGAPSPQGPSPMVPATQLRSSKAYLYNETRAT